MQRLKIALTVLAFALPSALSAGPRQSAEMHNLVWTLTEQFFATMRKGDFTAEYAFGAESFYRITPVGEWMKVRRQYYDLVGETPELTPHTFSYYPQENLYVAVDFSGRVNEGRDVCGFVIWEIASDNKMGFIRLETNIIDHELFRQMPLKDAQSQLFGWKCPPEVAERVFGLSN